MIDTENRDTEKFRYFPKITGQIVEPGNTLRQSSSTVSCEPVGYAASVNVMSKMR